MNLTGGDGNVALSFLEHARRRILAHLSDTRRHCGANQVAEEVERLAQLWMRCHSDSIAHFSEAGLRKRRLLVHDEL